MKILSRAEELIMLSILRLEQDAYCVPILQQAQKSTGEKWTLGGIYIPLGRLEKKGYIESYLADPTPERGGRSKRYYKVTALGIKALKQIREVERAMWEGMSENSLEDLV